MIGMFEYWWHHGLISDETLASGLKVCLDGSTLIKPSPECQKIMDKVTEELGNIDVYSIYTPPCDKGSAFELRLKRSRHRRVSRLGHQLLSSLKRARERRWPDDDLVQAWMLPAYDPCVDFYATKYMNLPEVQKAMHANVTGSIEYPWSLCRSVFVLHIVPHFGLSSLRPICSYFNFHRTNFFFY